jgi:hypothetical protein
MPSSLYFELRSNRVNDDSMMIQKREISETIEERGTGSTKYARFSSRAMGKRKAIAISILVLFALMLIAGKFYTTEMIFGKLWAGFWVFVIFVAVWLIVAVDRVLRKGP